MTGSGPEKTQKWTKTFGPKHYQRKNRKNDLLCYKVTFVIIFTSVFKWTCGRWRYSLFWFVENWSNHCPLSSSFSNYFMVMIFTCTIVVRFFKCIFGRYFSKMVIFWLNSSQFYHQRESNPKGGFPHRISGRNFDQKWVSLARNELSHLVLLSVNGVQIFVVWWLPYQLRVLPNLVEFFVRAEKIHFHTICKSSFLIKKNGSFWLKIGNLASWMSFRWFVILYPKLEFIDRKFCYEIGAFSSKIDAFKRKRSIKISNMLKIN